MLNNMKTVMLMAALTGLFMGVGYIIAPGGGWIVALVLAFIMNFFAFWFSDTLVLKMSKAREADPSEQPELHRITENLAQKAGIPKPKVYIIDNPSPNAFATGRSRRKAAVAATTGILSLMSRDELEGVMAHELSHVLNRDTLTSTIVATIAGAISFIANMAIWSLMLGGSGRRRGSNGLEIIGVLATMILAPIAAMLIQLAISRSREYQADASGAKLLGNPLTLASALEKLDAAVRRKPMQVNQSTAHLYIVNPLKGERRQEEEVAGAHAFDGLFSTHPPIAKRVERLRGMARGMGIYYMP